MYILYIYIYLYIYIFIYLYIYIFIYLYIYLDVRENLQETMAVPSKDLGDIGGFHSFPNKSMKSIQCMNFFP